MAVPEQTPYIEYIANGSTNSFALEFDCENKDHLIVLVDDIEPSLGTWSLNNGAVFFNVAPDNGKQITIQRNTPFQRDSDFQSYDNSFKPHAVNKGFDWIWFKLQELGYVAGVVDKGLKTEILNRIRADEEILAHITAEYEILKQDYIARDDVVKNDYIVRDAALKNYVDQLIGLITGDPSFDGITTDFILHGGRTQKDINDQYLHLTDFKYLANGQDWSDAIIAAEAQAFSRNMGLNIPSGIYGYSKNITFRVHVFGQGLENTILNKLAPATITILRCGVRDIYIGPTTWLDGDTSDGLVADGLDRKYIENVYVRFHGGNGFVYKRGNLSRFYLRSRENKKNGVVFAKEPISGDNKCVDFWFEITGNNLNGYVIESSAIDRDISAQNKGYVISQNNGKAGIVDNTYDAILNGIGNDITAYTEYGGGVWHQSGLKASRIFYQNMSHPSFRNEASKTNIVSFIDSALGSRTTLFESFNSIEIQNASLVGQLKLTQSADRQFTLDVTGSSAGQELIIGNMLTLKKDGTDYLRAYKIGATLNFSSIPAKGSTERTIPIGTTLISAQVIVSATPAISLPSGLVWNSYINPSDLTKATIRLTNVTDAAISTTDTVWKCQVFI